MKNIILAYEISAEVQWLHTDSHGITKQIFFANTMICINLKQKRNENNCDINNFLKLYTTLTLTYNLDNFIDVYFYT